MDPRRNLAEMDDCDLVAAFDGDPEAVEEFYRRHVRGLTRYVTRVVGDGHDAADLVAAAFLAALESAAGFDPSRGEPVAWLYGIAANLIAGRNRRSGIESRALRRLWGRRPAAPDDYGRVDEQVDARRRGGGPLAELSALPPAEREVVALIVLDDLTVTEAAGVLGIRPATARMRLARARDRFTNRPQEG
ncbi:RNA polymerase sigma factor [Phytohabitans rumicis]|uniref:RNA polymerase sigma factor n=1 Tax=Phytohabitans rumicis TaxID=1076125 RepID=UPI001C497CB2|nr:RNA polymerase sigma factor [Phytohabitans rumicis]